MGCCLSVIRPKNKPQPEVVVSKENDKLNLTNEPMQPDSNMNQQPETIPLQLVPTKIASIQEVTYPLSQKEEEFTQQFHMSDVILEGNEDEYYQPGEIGNQTHLPSIILKNNTKIQWAAGEQIGQGSFGKVIIGMNKDSGKVMAVKQVELTNQQIDVEKIQSLEIEINLLSRLEHKNIVSYYGTERTNSHMNIFLEYIAGQGGSLQGVLKKFGLLKESTVKAYMRQILEGLIYLHDHGVVHRDIKSANILVDSVGVCKLADFGSSKRLADIARNADSYRSIQGTPNYMAPEVVLQQRSGRKSDIWSLGCTMIEIATGKPPWHDFSNAITIMLKIARTQEPPPVPENLSQEAKDFLFNCMQIDPKKRWTARRLLGHPFLDNQNQLKPGISPKRRQNKARSPVANSQRMILPSPRGSQDKSKALSQFEELANLENNYEHKDKIGKFNFTDEKNIENIGSKIIHIQRRHSDQMEVDKLHAKRNSEQLIPFTTFSQEEIHLPPMIHVIQPHVLETEQGEPKKDVEEPRKRLEVPTDIWGDTKDDFLIPEFVGELEYLDEPEAEHQLSFQPVYSQNDQPPINQDQQTPELLNHGVEEGNESSMADQVDLVSQRQLLPPQTPERSSLFHIKEVLDTFTVNSSQQGEELMNISPVQVLHPKKSHPEFQNTPFFQVNTPVERRLLV